MKTYDKFAAVYDQLGADSFSVDMVAYTFRIMRRFKIKATCGLDLCCGTGTAICLLAEGGLTMAGLDQSPGMLREARKKLKGKKVRLYRQSLPRFDIRSPKDRRRQRFDLVTCFFDSLNYLENARQLRAAFRAVNRHLVPGGWFIFDMNTPEALRTIWGERIWGGVKKDLAWIWRNRHREQQQIAECATTFFVKSGKHWKRFDELHVEKAYDNSEIKRLLRESGFTVKGFYRCFSFTRPTARTCRICAVVRRPI